jgi:hypothetical protein
MLYEKTVECGQFIHEHPLKALLTILGLASLMAAVVALAPVFQGQHISQEGLALAKWTAWKKFRDECRSTKVRESS